MQSIQEIFDSADSWALENLTYSPTGKLEIIVAEARTSSKEEPVGSLGEVDLGIGRKVDQDDFSKRLRIIFDFATAYQVLDSSFRKHPNEDEYSGRDFRIYKKSTYIDFLTDKRYLELSAGNHVHYSVECQGEIIDAISVKPPTVSVY
jgi:hypothetical protein